MKPFLWNLFISDICRVSKQDVYSTKIIVDSNNTYPTDIAAKSNLTPVIVVLPTYTDFEKLKNEKECT